MPLDHIAMHVPEAKLDQMVEWLVAAGEPLGFREHFRPMKQLVALGEEKPWFWVFSDPKLSETPEGWRHPHMGFVAEDAEAVGKWYEAAIKAGGTDNGAPGPRPNFGPTYYAAFVKDPVLGINFEAVCKTWSPSETQATGDKTDDGHQKVAIHTDEKSDQPLDGIDGAKVETDQPQKKRPRRNT